MKAPGAQYKLFNALALVVISLLYASALRAQEPPVQTLTAPPPVKVITLAERGEMNDAKEPKARLKITLELAENRLLKAEQATTEHNYENASGELGRYWALIENALAFLRVMTPDKDRTRDLYKRLELTLRAHGPRLTSLRRGTPSEYAVWIKDVEEVARKGRTEALESFYGHTVFREVPQKPGNQNRPAKQPDGNAGPGDKP
jgi:hypothetical protein